MYNGGWGVHPLQIAICGNKCYALRPAGRKVGYNLAAVKPGQNRPGRNLRGELS